MSKNIAVIDGDMFRFKAAAAGEKRTVMVTHKSSGRQIECKTRTEFYGHWKKKNGGILADINKEKDTSFTADDFEYEDIQTPEPIANVLHTAKVMVEKELKETNADGYVFLLGEGDSFRKDLSTIIGYKQNRKDSLRPVLMGEVKDYLIKKFKAKIITGIECDDAVVMECYKQPNRFAIVEDKDFWGCPIRVWDVNQKERGIVDCNKFGHLFLGKKGKVRGEGRIFLYWQIASGDNTDNYFANSASDIKWGDKSAYEALKRCRNDKEALQALINIYQGLYPSPQEITGWRGDNFVVDWKYVLNENFQLARMLRFDGDNVSIDDVFNNLGIKT